MGRDSSLGDVSKHRYQVERVKVYVPVKIWQRAVKWFQVGKSRVFELECGHQQRRFCSQGILSQMRCWECEKERYEREETASRKAANKVGKTGKRPGFRPSH